MAVRLNPDQHSWMTEPSTRAVMQALNAAGPDNARFVGGCVRNALMGVPVDDVDIATVLSPSEVMAAAEVAGLKSAATGLDHGTVTLIAAGKPFEVTTLRTDVETDGRRAVIAHTTDWAEDAGRRDFRLNAIYSRADGELFDPFDGIEDAQRGVVRFIGRPQDRIAEDYLRILRFYRFNAWYARGTLDAAGHAACVAARSGLVRLSVERVWKELKKLLSAPDPRTALRAMQEGHVLDDILTPPLDFHWLLRIISTDIEEGLAADPLLRVVGLVSGGAERVDALCTTLKVSNAERARMSAAVAGARPEPGLDRAERDRLLYERGVQAFADQIRLSIAAGEGEPALLRAELAYAADYQRPVFPLTGKALLRAGYAPGPVLGAALARAEAAWIASGFSLDRNALLDLLRQGGGEA